MSVGAATTPVITAIGAENTYASVLSQIGGRYVRVSSILNNPATNPHAFEVSPNVARQGSAATLIGLPDHTPNPRLWYSPVAMPAAAKAMATQKL